MTTKDVRKALLGDLVDTARAAREAKAAELYGLEVLRSAMVKAAAGGFDTATMPGPVGLDLRGTAAAETAEAWLKGEGIVFTWDPRTGGGATDTAAVDLVLTWRVSVRAS